MPTTKDYTRNQRAATQVAVAAIFTEHPGDWTPKQSEIVGLAWNDECPAALCLPQEYQPLLDAGILQNNNGWLVIKKVSNHREVRTEGFHYLPDCELNATQAADWQFEDSRNHLYESGRLQR